MKLKGKVAIITGSARGIGKAYAIRLSEEGAKVVLGDILDTTPVQEEIESKGGEAMSLKLDVTDEKATEEMALKTVDRFGRIDILVNNAAMFATIEKKPFWEISSSEWDDVIRVNLKGTFLCCKAVFPQMKKQGSGKIINISSGTFYKGVPFFLHYVTTKGGIIAFTRAMSRELGDYGICVNAIAPGLTISDGVIENPSYTDEYNEMVVRERCIKRIETPEDLTGTVVFLASEDSDMITGQTIVVDGGAVFN
ncbi:MAG: 3-oxoacyl-ACP reductase FabG [Deltaproteobacteria bacterium]|nr:3-oxoacyl-ACP reductase FabG [Deltaproteobacteria bacterium]